MKECSSPCVSLQSDLLGPTDVLYFADICAGPGGFSEYVLWRKQWEAKGFGLTLKGKNICVPAGGRWLDVVVHSEYCMYGVIPEAISPNSELGKRNGHRTKIYVHYNRLCAAKLAAILR